MKNIKRIIVSLLLVCIILTACGSNAPQATPTQDPAVLAATQTAQAPTATNTPEPTATSTSTPTETPVPTETPDAKATSAAATQEAKAATQQANKTATAVSAQATQAAVDAVWAQLVADGTVTMNKGTEYPVDDFEQSWAQRNWYQWWSFDYTMADFVIMSHIEWEIPADSNFGVGGCGFAVRIKDENNHLVTFLSPRSNVSLGAMTPSGFQYQSFHWQNPDNPVYSSIPPALTGSHDFIVVAEKDFVTAYIDGVKTFQWYVALTSPGDMGYTIVSGTNKDYGINCKFSNTTVWELVP
jgi:hypothetical protein